MLKRECLYYLRLYFYTNMKKISGGFNTPLVHFQTTVFRVEARQFLFSNSPPGKFYRLSLPIKEKLRVKAFVGY